MIAKYYAIQQNTTPFFNPLPPIKLSRWCGFLERPLGWVLSFLGAYTENFTLSTQHIEIPFATVDRFLITILQEHYLWSKEQPKCFVIGRDIYMELITGADSLTRPLSLNYNSPSFRGIKLVLHPNVRGAIALDFAP